MCVNSFEKEKEKILQVPGRLGEAPFGEFLDNPEKLKGLTNQLLEVLGRVWRSLKWKAYASATGTDINEGSYVCEVLSPLINIIMSDLPVDIDIWGVWDDQASSASAERKGSRKRARRPNYMVIAQINNKKVEFSYLKTGRPNSSYDKQLRNHKKLCRLAKDSIDETRMSKNKRAFEKVAMKTMLTIFTINIAGEVMKISCMCRYSALYRISLLEQANIPLHILTINSEDVYRFIHSLLTFRTAIACTI